ncbi:MAG TPA: zinc ribbon domain-containing protein [Ktedonobacterales bacterium]
MRIFLALAFGGLVVASFISAFGWGIILWPLAVGGGAVILLTVSWHTYRTIQALPETKRLRALDLKESIGRLEAAQGIPVASDGSCPQCGEPLAADAKFCAYCRAPTVRYAMICPQCRNRNFEDAVYCAECGAALTRALGPATSLANLAEPSEALAPAREAHPSTPTLVGYLHDVLVMLHAH